MQRIIESEPWTGKYQQPEGARSVSGALTDAMIREQIFSEYSACSHPLDSDWCDL